MLLACRWNRNYLLALHGFQSLGLESKIGGLCQDIFLHGADVNGLRFESLSELRPERSIVDRRRYQHWSRSECIVTESEAAAFVDRPHRLFHDSYTVDALRRKEQQVVESTLRVAHFENKNVLRSRDN